MNLASDTSMAAVNVVQGESFQSVALAGAAITADPLPTVNAIIPDPVYAGNDTLDDTMRPKLF